MSNVNTYLLRATSSPLAGRKVIPFSSFWLISSFVPPRSATEYRPRDCHLETGCFSRISDSSSPPKSWLYRLRGGCRLPACFRDHGTRCALTTLHESRQKTGCTPVVHTQQRRGTEQPTRFASPARWADRCVP